MLTNHAGWDSVVSNHRSETAKRLWEEWSKNPIEWRRFINAVESAFGTMIAEDLYNYHDEWRSEND